MTRERIAKLPNDDWRRKHSELNEPYLSRNLAVVDCLQAIGQGHGRSAGEVAIAWALQNPAVTGAIVGARNAKQAEGVMRAGDLTLSGEEILDIAEFFAATAV